MAFGRTVYFWNIQPDKKSCTVELVVICTAFDSHWIVLFEHYDIVFIMFAAVLLVRGIHLPTWLMDQCFQKCAE